jgi:hypothetical protein
MYGEMSSRDSIIPLSQGRHIYAMTLRKFDKEVENDQPGLTSSRHLQEQQVQTKTEIIRVRHCHFPTVQK